MAGMWVAIILMGIYGEVVGGIVGWCAALLVFLGLTGGSLFDDAMNRREAKRYDGKEAETPGS